MIALGFIFISLMPSGVTGARSLAIIWGSLFGNGPNKKATKTVKISAMYTGSI
ncbi:hypothetical protein ES703_109376 [subsurface metagenome]